MNTVHEQHAQHRRDLEELAELVGSGKTPRGALAEFLRRRCGSPAEPDPDALARDMFAAVALHRCMAGPAADPFTVAKAAWNYAHAMMVVRAGEGPTGG